MVFRTRFFIKEKTGHNHLRVPSIKGSRSDTINRGRLSVKKKRQKRNSVRWRIIESRQTSAFYTTKRVDSKYLDSTLQQFPKRHFLSLNAIIGPLSS